MANQSTPVIQVKDSNVGIGTTSPTRKLQITDGEVYVRFNPTAVAGTYILGAADGKFYFIPESTFVPTMTLVSGNVLIGTTTDSGFKLNVNGVTYSESIRTAIQGINVDGYGFLTQTISGEMTLLGHNVRSSSSTANTALVVNSGWISSMIKQYYNDGITFHTDTTMYNAGDVYPMAATERMRITSGGNVLIGTTTNPGYKLYVSGSTGGQLGSPSTNATAFNFGDTSRALTYMPTVGSGNYNWASVANGSALFNTTGSDWWVGNHDGSALRFVQNSSLVFYTNSGAQGIWNSTGLGIGTTSPPVKLRVQSSGSNFITPDNNDVAAVSIYNSNNSSSNAHAIISMRTQISGGSPYISFDVENETGYSVGMENGSNQFRIAYGWNSLTTYPGLVLTPATSPNVLIGTTTDVGQKLYVDGNIRTTQAFIGGGLLEFSGAWSASPYNGSSWVRAAANNGVFLVNNGITKWVGLKPNNDFVVNSDNLVVNSSTGNVLINTSTDNGYKLAVNGTAYVGGTFYQDGGNYRIGLTLPYPGANYGNGIIYIRVASSANSRIGSLKIRISSTWNWTPAYGYVEANVGFYWTGTEFHAPYSGTNIIAATGYAAYTLNIGQPVVENGYVSIPIYSSQSNPIYTLIDATPDIDPSFITTSGWSTTTHPGTSDVYIQTDLGIGTRNPSTPIHIAATAAVSPSLRLQTTDSTTNGSIQWSNSANSILALIGSNGNVGDGNGNLEFMTGGLTTRMLIASNGNVMIGTTTDSGYKLDVNGTFRSVGDGIIKNAFIGEVPTYGAANAQFSHTSRAVAGEYSFLSANDGETFINSKAGFNIRFRVNNADQMIINSSGNVGIGTTTPEQKFHVQGNGLMATFQNSSTAADGYTQLEFKAGNRLGYIWLGNQNTSSWAGAGGLNIYTADGNMDLWTGASQRIRIMNAGNVIIGSTTDAGFKLDVHGEILGRDDIRILNTYALILNGSDANWRIGRNTITDSGWLTGNTTQIVVSNASSGQGFQVVNSGGTALFEIEGISGYTRISISLGVGVNPSGTTGRIDASNDIVAYSTSDRRLKENITPIPFALDKVKALTGVMFDWKEETKEAHGHSGRDTGIIAQEVQEVMPTAVRTNDTGYLAVRYEKLIGLLIEANKELANRVEHLESKLK